MHAEVDEFAARHGHDEAIYALDIGGGAVNGNVRHHWPAATWTVVDIEPGEGVDVVADATDYKALLPRIGLGTYQLVVCTEVFEHVRRWRNLVKVGADALAPGGTFLITCAGPGRPPHGSRGTPEPLDGEWYQNVDTTSIVQALTSIGLRPVTVVASAHPADSRVVAVKPGAGV